LRVRIPTADSRARSDGRIRCTPNAEVPVIGVLLR
jgi:hypothetical protein